MAVSTAPAAKQQLITLFTGWAGLTGVTVTWGPPSKEIDIAYDHIWLGDVEADQGWHSLGAANARREEEYTLEVVARIIRKGDDEKGTEDRLWVVVGEIEKALRSDPGLAGVLGNQSGYAGITHIKQSTTPAEPQSWVSVATITVACQALI